MKTSKWIRWGVCFVMAVALAGAAGCATAAKKTVKAAIMAPVKATKATAKMAGKGAKAVGGAITGRGDGRRADDRIKANKKND